MKTSFKLTSEELTFLSFELSLRSPNYKKVLTKSRLILSFAFLMIAVSTLPLTENKVFSGTVLILGTISVAVYPYFIKRSWKQNLKKHYEAKESQRYHEKQIWDLNPKRLLVSQGGVKSEFSWKTIEKLFIYKHYYLLRLDTLQGLILPKSALDKKKMLEFEKLFKKIPSEEMPNSLR